MNIEIGPLTLGVWGIFAAIGIGAGVILIARRATVRPVIGITPQQVFNIAFWVVIAAIIGARLMFVMVSPDINSLVDALAVHKGGLSAFGAIIGAGITGTILAKKRRIPVLEGADIAAPGILLAEGIVRIGSFVVRNHPGRITEYTWLAVTGPDGMPRHEVGLYLSAAAFLGFFGLLYLEKKYHIWLYANPGTLTVIMLAWYSATRILLDFLRAADLPMSDPRFYGLTSTQYIASISLVGIVGYIMLRYKRYVEKEN